MTFATVVYEKRGTVAWVTLNRPEVLNAYNLRMRDELAEVFAAVRDDAEVRALVVRGAGRAFCAGADLGRPLRFILHCFFFAASALKYESTCF